MNSKLSSSKSKFSFVSAADSFSSAAAIKDRVRDVFDFVNFGLLVDIEREIDTVEKSKQRHDNKLNEFYAIFRRFESGVRRLLRDEEEDKDFFEDDDYFEKGEKEEGMMEEKPPSPMMMMTKVVVEEQELMETPKKEIVFHRDEEELAEETWSIEAEDGGGNSSIGEPEETWSIEAEDGAGNSSIGVEVGSFSSSLPPLPQQSPTPPPTPISDEKDKDAAMVNDFGLNMDAAKVPNDLQIFVGGLLSMVTEQELKNLFSRYGRVAGVKILPRIRGKNACAFVAFNSSQIVRDLLMNPPNFQQFQRYGRHCRLYVEAKCSTAMIEIPDTYKIFVTNLPSGTRLLNVKEFFEQYGTVTGAKMRPWRCRARCPQHRARLFCAYVAFDCAETAERVIALGDTLRFGQYQRRINVKRANDVGSPDFRVGEPPANL